MTAIPLRADNSSIRTRKLSPDELDAARKYRVSQALKQLIQDRNQDQAWLARMLGISTGTLNPLINGSSLPGFATIEKLLLIEPSLAGAFFPNLNKR